ncbi:hypothetical protein HK405_012935 [Cladochytrium tenue]|nr:hypothetical protein HK405_012935 [Cladochytrium tenue]
MAMGPPAHFTTTAPADAFDTAEHFGAFSSPAAIAAAAASALASSSAFVAPLMLPPSPAASPGFSTLALHTQQRLLFQLTPTQLHLPLTQVPEACTAPVAAWSLPSPALSQLASPLPPPVLPQPAPTLALQPSLPPLWPSLPLQVPLLLPGELPHRTLLEDLVIHNALLAHLSIAPESREGNLQVELPSDGAVEDARVPPAAIVIPSPPSPSGATSEGAWHSDLRRRPPTAASAGHEGASGGAPRLRRFTCQQAGCCKTFFRAQDLTRHQSVHRGAATGRFACPNAGCACHFGRADVANRHARLHCAAGRRIGTPAAPPPRRGRPPGSGSSSRKNRESAVLATVAVPTSVAGAAEGRAMEGVGESPAGNSANHS